MKISEVIAQLEQLKEQEGDIRTFISGNNWKADTDYVKEVEEDNFDTRNILIRVGAGRSGIFDNLWKKYINPESQKGEKILVIKLKKS